MYSPITGTGDGAAPVVTLTFPYLSRADIHAEVDGVEVPFTWTGASQVTFSAGVTSGLPWKVYRATSPGARLVDFTDGSVLSETDLDKDSLQAFYLVGEVAGQAAADLSNEALTRKSADDALSNLLLVESATRANGDNALLTALSGTILGNASLPAATVGDLAALDYTAGAPAFLYESGREGIFTPFIGDRSAEVALDPNKAIYVPFASDETGAAGAWVRAFNGSPSVKWFGAKGDNIADDLPAITQGIATSSALGANALQFPPGTYYVSASLSIGASGFKLYGDGVTIRSTETTSYLVGFLGSDIDVHGIRFFLDVTSQTPWIVEVTGNNVRLLDGTLLEKPEGTGGTVMYIRAGATGFRMIRAGTKGSNGFNIFGVKDAQFMLNKFVERAIGGDDAIAIKAIFGQGDGIAENIVIAYNYFENAAAFCSIGSEIGRNGAADAAHSAGVRGVQVIGNRGKACSSILYVKPGQIQNYWDGFVYGVTASDNTLEDPLGTKMGHIINVAPGRGAVVADIKGSNNRAIGRTTWTGGAAIGYRIYVQDDTATPSTAPTSVSDVNVGLTLYDPYKGAVAGGAAPGSPFSSAADVSLSNIAYGSISGVVINVESNGTTGPGIIVEAGLDDAVFISRAKLSNINTAGTGTYGGISTRSRIEVSLDVSIEMANGQPYVFPLVGQGEVRCPALDRQVYLGTQGASAVPALALWSASKRCELMAVDMVVSNALAQDPNNYTVVALANLDLAGTNFASWRSATGTSSGSSKYSGTTPNAATPIYRRADITTPADQAQAIFARGGRLKFTKSNGFGTGQPLNDTQFIIRSAPF